MAKAKKTEAKTETVTDADRELADKRADDADTRAIELAKSRGERELAGKCSSPYATDAELLQRTVPRHRPGTT